MASFSFSFSGDDIEDDEQGGVAPQPLPPAPASAFPVQGKPQLPPRQHDLSDMLAQLPSKVAYSTLDVTLDSGQTLQLPRRELWDVRVQLMAEDDGDADATEGLGQLDVKTGVYEGGFKSWESSVDLVKVLADSYVNNLPQRPIRVVELGCGTALPSLAVFQWALGSRHRGVADGTELPLSFVVADYNPSVLHLVTLPNFILVWALWQRETNPVLEPAFSMEGELELLPDVLAAFKDYLVAANISIFFMSGGWSPEFVDLLYQLRYNSIGTNDRETLLLGAETIYSPFALSAFAETVFLILGKEQRECPDSHTKALVAAKRLYFGVGGSLDDFIEKAREIGAKVIQLREETEGVRRGVVQCTLSSPLGIDMST